MANYLPRAEAARMLMDQVGDELLVCGLGSPVSDVSSVKDRDLNFYLIGAMGRRPRPALGWRWRSPIAPS